MQWIRCEQLFEVHDQVGEELVAALEHAEYVEPRAVGEGEADVRRLLDAQVGCAADATD